MTTTIQALLAQLGTALPMLGARDVVASENAIQFRIRGCKAGNKIRIELRPDDTYSVELWRVKGADTSMPASVDGVHADRLHTVLSSLTGLDVRL